MNDGHRAPESGLQATLEQASEGLLYLSEGEAPFEFIRLPAPAGTLTPEAFRALVGAPGDAAVEEVTLERFFHGHIEGSDPNDPVAQAAVPRYRALKATLLSALPELRVFRVGSVDIRCYLVGTTPGGSLAGLTTTAYES